MTRQQSYQLRHRAKGLCNLCPDKAVPGSWHCLEHMISGRELQRIRQGNKRRYRSKSYRLMGL